MNEHRFSISRDGKFVFRTEWTTDTELVDQTRHFLKCGFPNYQGFVIHEDSRPAHYYSVVVSATKQDLVKDRLERVKDLKLTDEELSIARGKGPGQRNKIQAIKAVKERLSHLGLAEAKTLVERDMGEL